MQSEAAARLAASLRAVKKLRGLSGVELAEEIGRLTGQPRTFGLEVKVSRWFSGRKRLIDVDPDLFVIAQALEISRERLAEMILAAVIGGHADAECAGHEIKMGDDL